MKFAFVIPLIDRERSRSWPAVLEKLEHTVRSALSQSEKEVIVIVVAGDSITLSITDDRLSIYKHKTSKLIDNSFVGKSVDKGRKMYFGLNEAKKRGAEWIMMLDADDLVSDRLVSVCLSKRNLQMDALIVDSGYIEYGDSPLFLHRVPKCFNEVCGSGNIFRSSLVEVDPKVLDDGTFDDFRFLINHQYFKKNCIELLRAKVGLVTFPAVIYRVHNNNWFARPKAQTITEFLKRFVRAKLFTSAIRTEFGY